MLKPLGQYLKAEAAPRWQAIFFTWETLFSLAIVGVFVKCGDRLFETYPKVSDITTGVIAYASIALGFCVAGLTISLTLPEPKFTLRLATHGGQKTSAYSDLLFVFSWTAFAHWIAVLTLFAFVLFVDGSAPLLPKGHSVSRTWVVALTAGLVSYCLCQFLITLITLSQVGSVYIKFLAETPSKTGDGSR
jgi:hypothetical protein